MSEEEYNELGERIAVSKLAHEGNMVANQNRQVQYQMEEQEKSLAEAQLDCDETLEKISHLLRQDVLIIENGEKSWKTIDDKKKRVLTQEGVEKLMQVMQNYINKETLLSNFDEKTICRRMLEFSLGITALFYMKYEIFFRTPTLDECYTLLEERISRRLSSRELSCKLMKQKFDKDMEEEKILEEFKGREEYELKKIMEETRRLNLREFEMIFIQLKALVEATHNRAWKGEERGSLRRHLNIQEVIGGKSPQQDKKKWGLF